MQRRPGAELQPADLHQLGRRQIGRERLHQVAADERQLEERARARELRHQRLQDGLLPRPPCDVGVGRIELVFANARIDQRAVAAHVLYALPEPPALPAFAARVRRIGTVELVREDRLGDVDVDAAELVDQLREAVEVDHHHVVDRQAGVRVHGPLREPGSPDLEGRVDLVGPVAGDVRDA